MAKPKQTKKPISKKRKDVLKNAYQTGNIDSIKTTKRERAYVSKAAGGWARAEKGLKSATGRYYNRNEVKHLQDFLRVSKTDWNTLTIVTGKRGNRRGNFRQRRKLACDVQLR